MSHFGKQINFIPTSYCHYLVKPALLDGWYYGCLQEIPLEKTCTTYLVVLSMWTGRAKGVVGIDWGLLASSAQQVHDAMW